LRGSLGVKSYPKTQSKAIMVQQYTGKTVEIKREEVESFPKQLVSISLPKPELKVKSKPRPKSMLTSSKGGERA
jgi:hypothetical protein